MAPKKPDQEPSLMSSMKLLLGTSLMAIVSAFHELAAKLLYVFPKFGLLKKLKQKTKKLHSGLKSYFEE